MMERKEKKKKLLFLKKYKKLLVFYVGGKINDFPMVFDRILHDLR